MVNIYLWISFCVYELQIAKKFSSQREWDTNLTQLLQSNKILSTRDVCNSLNMLQTQLNTLIKLEPLTNKLLSIPQVFVSNELSDTTQNALNEVSRFNLTEISITVFIIHWSKKLSQKILQLILQIIVGFL